MHPANVRSKDPCVFCESAPLSIFYLTRKSRQPVLYPFITRIDNPYPLFLRAYSAILRWYGVWKFRNVYRRNVNKIVRARGKYIVRGNLGENWTLSTVRHCVFVYRWMTEIGARISFTMTWTNDRPARRLASYWQTGKLACLLPDLGDLWWTFTGSLENANIWMH